jgi:predicted Zn-dependent protease
MEIKTVGDLIPYHKSLQELWHKEEFQPVLELVKSLHQDEVNAIQTANLNEPAERLALQLAVIQVRLKVYNFIFNLPDIIQTAKKQLEVNEIKKSRFGQAQERGEI